MPQRPALVPSPCLELDDDYECTSPIDIKPTPTIWPLLDLQGEMRQIKERLSRITENQVRLHADVKKFLVDRKPTESEVSMCHKKTGATVASDPASPKGRVVLTCDPASPTRIVSGDCLSPKLSSKRGLRKSVSMLNPEFAMRSVPSDEKRRPSKSSFSGAMQTEDSDKATLQKMFQAFEISQSEREARTCCSIFKDRDRMEMALDSAIAVVIILNALFIGIRTDHENEDIYWFVIDVSFSVIFLIELAIKLSLHGCRGQFCGPSKYSNCFDACLIGIDLMQLILDLVVENKDTAASGSNAPSASLFRIIRLGKLVRIIRLLKAPVFKDLLAMMQGMLGGMVTLGWSLILFVITVYVMALIFREAFGRQFREHVYDYFNSVPRSMFTTFRCSFGDCSDRNGVPIFEFVTQEYGPVYSWMYCLFVFFVSIGLFNVISAIFVESTVAAASAMQAEKRKARMRDENRWSHYVTTVFTRLLDITSGHDNLQDDLANNVEEIYNLEVPNEVIDELAADDVVGSALSALDIDPEDRDYLSEILDPDNGGTINVIELVEGLRRLRGEPRRSDIVTVNLILRNIQLTIKEILDNVTKDK
eukprot:TRINITY_DN2539_c0_g1_i1.p1 TRINITY_DN2539_c0_g1~~TRINITY_DN2539_c0_g1_i1.p1  ORF type:complete len:591 (-),score=98.65 TRINITY_DN2539_c0_g1_i1:293-2065(-)